jgi:hypothetical protein
MLMIGARYEEAKKCYYTDSHESDENRKDRSERFIPEKARLAVREAVWVRAPWKGVSEAALAYTREAYGLKEDADLPLYRNNEQVFVRAGEEEELDMVKVQVNFLRLGLGLG